MTTWHLLVLNEGNAYQDQRLSAKMRQTAGRPARARHGRGALYEAAEEGRVRTVSMLLMLGKNPDRSDSFGITPLQIAAWNNHCKVVAKLAKHSANVNVPDRIGHTALFKAVWKNCEKCVRRLAAAGANVNAQDHQGNTPLVLAAEIGLMDILAILGQCGSGLDTQNRWGHTALHVATLHANYDSVRYLLEKGANPDLRTHHGNTPLFYAAGHWLAGVTRGIMLQLIMVNCDLDLKGRDPDVANYKSMTPFELAVHVGNIQVATLLYLAGCDVSPIWRWMKSLRRILEDHSDFVQVVQSWAANPRSLEDLCRIQIRQTVRAQHRNLDALPLPRTMMRFVQLKELRDLVNH